MAFYFIVFIVIGFVVGLITPKDKKSDAYVWYVLISIGWFFIWGPFAFITLVELIIGDALARKIQGQGSAVGKENIDSGNIVDLDFTDVTNIVDDVENISPKDDQTKSINHLYYKPKTAVIGQEQYCSYDEWQRLGYQVKKGEKGCKRKGFSVLFHRSQVIRKDFY